MGWKIGKFFHRITNPKGIVNAVKAIPKIKLKNLALNVLKGGPVPGLVQSALEVSQPKAAAIHGALLDTTFKIGTSVALTPAGSFLANQAFDTASSFKSPSAGGQPMAFNIGGFLGQVGGILSGSGNSYLGTAGKALGIASSFIPTPSGRPPGSVATVTPATLVPGTVPVAAGRVPPAVIGGAGRVVGRSFFNRFPNLAAAIQGFRNTGRGNITRKKLYQGLKRFGPDLLISGGILTAAAVSELAVAGPGTRRMNPGNVKALRKSIRRLESFHRLCMKADKLRRHSPHRRMKHA